MNLACFINKSRFEAAATAKAEDKGPHREDESAGFKTSVAVKETLSKTFETNHL